MHKHIRATAGATTGRGVPMGASASQGCLVLKESILGQCKAYKSTVGVTNKETLTAIPQAARKAAHHPCSV